MKVTIEIPDELYRLAKAKSVLEGRPIREVAEELFRSYLEEDERRRSQGANRARGERQAPRPGGEAVPVWFGALRRQAERVRRHDLEAIRESIARGLARERDS